MDNYDEQAAYEDEGRDYANDRAPSRSRSRSPRRDREVNESRNRSASPNGRAGDNHGPPAFRRRYNDNDPDEPNAGSNLFITGLTKSVTDEDLRDAFSDHGIVDNASIVRDPHTRESRCFGFVKMSTNEEAEIALDKMHNYELKGKVISVEKAKRNKARTPTPGRYQGPIKRDTRGFGRDRYDDRRRRDDYRGSSRRDDRYSNDRYASDRGPPERSYRDRSDYGSSSGYGYGGRGGGRGDSYASRRDDRDDRDDRYGSARGGGRDRGGERGGERSYGYSSGGPPGDPYGASAGGRAYDDDRR